MLPFNSINGPLAARALFSVFAAVGGLPTTVSLICAQVVAAPGTGQAPPAAASIDGQRYGTFDIGKANTKPFHVLPTVSSSFYPGTPTLPGLPTITATNPDGSTVVLDSIGYQDGVFINGTVIYFPWQVLDGATTWLDAIHNAIPQSVMLSYSAGAGIDGFDNPSKWSWFDLRTLPYEGKGTIQPGNLDYNLPVGFMGGTIVGNVVYPTPNGVHPYPVFVAYDVSRPFDSPGSYQTFVPPPMGGPLGAKYGWCSATSDGRYVYYAPLANTINGDSGNIFRYDTTQPFGDIGSWSNFDMGTSISPDAESFQSVAYDGYRFVYFVPFHKKLIVRYDTWGGDYTSNPAAFSNPESYNTLDPTQLGTAGYPTIAGQGTTVKLWGFTGAAVAWDSARENEYLYFVPWATFPGNRTGGAGQGAQNPVLQSTAARVRIGTQSGSVWNYVDITSTTTNPEAAPDWEMYDLSLLTENAAWPTAWAKVYPAAAGSFAGQSTMAGWQMTFVSTSPAPAVGFIPDTAQFVVEHNVDHSLSDPSGWYVAQVPLCCAQAPPTLCPGAGNCGTMGGGYDPDHGILYPSSPENPLFAIQFTSHPQ